MDALLHADPQAWLQAQLRAQQLAGADPLHEATLQGLARRAAALPEGALRTRLSEKLWAYCQAPRPPAMPDGPPPLRPIAHPLQDWMAALQARCGAPGEELRSLRQHRHSFGRLRLAQRLAQTPSASAAPAQSLGPLNTLALVPKALTLLQQVSPDYLERLVGYLDTLAALSGEAAPPAEAPQPPKRRRKA
jgi:hypothetical protein